MSTTTKTPVIQFIREERDCGHNTNLKPGERKIYDFRVVIDGEHRATFKSRVYSRGYELTAPVPGIYTRIHTVDERDIKRPVTADTKAEFQPMIETLLADGLIPSIQEMQAIKARYEQAQRAKEAADAEGDRVARLEAAGPELYAALKDFLAFQETMPCYNFEKMEPVKAARAAIHKAETGETE